MESQKTFLIFLIGALFVISILILQGIWFRQAFLAREKEFELHANLSLKKVAEQIYSYNGLTPPTSHLVSQLTPNYFVVATNSYIEPGLLETWLKSAFQSRAIEHDFEYGIYDCTYETMVYANFVSMGEGPVNHAPMREFPDWNHDNYYFGVLFPQKKSALLFDMKHWWITSLLLILVFLYFSYVIWLFLRQKKLTEIQRDFVNNMTHEFQTPLSTIGVSSQVLEKTRLQHDPERTGKYTQIILEECQKLQKQIERILLIDSGTGLSIHREKLALSDLLEEFIRRLKDHPAHSNLAVTVHINSPGWILGDQTHIRGMLQNLIDNATKYSTESPKINISLEETSRSTVLSIEDKGIGIPSHEQKKIFEKYYRVHTGNRHDVKGFGLGLYYIKTVMMSHQGRITLKSQPGSGSTFSLIFPKFSPNEAQ